MRRESGGAVTAALEGHCTTSRRVTNLTGVAPVVPAFVQAAGLPSSGGALTSVAYPSNVTAGNLLVVALGSLALDGVTGTVAVSDTLGSSWAAISAYEQAQNTYGVVLFSALATGSGPDTVTASYNASTGALSRMVVAEFSGAVTFDQRTAANGLTYPLDAGPLAITQAAEMLVGWSVSVNGSFTPGAGWTVAATSSNDALEYQITTVTGTYHPTWPGDGNTSQWTAVGCSFK